MKRSHLWRWLGLLASFGALAACGGSGGSSNHTVAALTGDPDDEVSQGLEKLVQRAFYVPADGQPIDD